ncbi:FKBP-type peptidyl-prolyl cis-trans isomerase [Curtobacterium sp. DN_7.5]|uniref:FKBP-type peptidyl-prolyl cis-trans isomerase n=1 Tax=Curtobacterium sp. DN_7.5 TaxID=3049047 RepID=UPI001F576B44|nr:FKBP-type peptidyl-prolyl cis-trans isomerase [Curtobacterium sp. DN_7.5]
MPVLHRTIPALLVTLGLAASLTACAASGAGTTPSSCDRPGAASEAVTATGAFGEEPKVSVPAGLTTKGTQVSVLKEGTGREVEDGTPVLIEYTVVDGETGKVAQTSGYSGTTAPITAGAANYGALGEAVECAHVGDRLAVALPKSALSSSSGTAGSSSSTKAEDAVIAVIDVKRAFDSRATGTPQLAGDGMPAVVLAPSGAPGITIPSWDAPKSDELHLLRKGSGTKLTAKDTAIIKYTAVTWSSDPSVTGSSWTDGSGAQAVPLAKGQVIDGVRNAIVGHRVGDQVLAVVHNQGSTDVYVIDLLGAMPR